MADKISVLTGQDFIEGSQNIDDTDILKLSNTAGYMVVEKKYFNKEDADLYGYSYNTEKAREILKEAGFSWNDEGKLLDKHDPLVARVKAVIDDEYAGGRQTVMSDEELCSIVGACDTEKVLENI